MRGEQEGSPFQKNRRLIDSLQRADELRHSLANQRTAFQGGASPFKDELNIPGLSGRNDARARQFRMMNNGRDKHDAAETTDPAADTHTDALDGVVSVPMLDSVLTGKGGRKGMMMMMTMSSRSKGKGKGGSSSSSRSRSKGKGKGKGSKSKGKSKGMRSSDSSDKRHPTFMPTTMAGAPTQAPRLTDKPTCAPSSGVFPQDVSGFFQAPTGTSSQLQKEIDSALSEIQVPSEFQEQCVER